MSEAFYQEGIPEKGAGEPERNAARKVFPGNLGTVRRNFSRLGWGVFTILISAVLAQALVMALAELWWPGWMESKWGMWILSYVPLYLVSVPLGLVVFRKTPAVKLPVSGIASGKLGVITCICFCMMYAGNLVGIVLTGILQLIPGVTASNPVESMTVGTAFLPRFLVMVIGAPFVEEYIFRKQLIDRMHLYGQKTAVVVSAVMFGLFHGNLSQFFYAFALGLVFGYVYISSGKLRYSIGLHMLINFMGGVVAPMLLEKLPLTVDGMLDLVNIGDGALWLAFYMLYALALIGLSIAGLILLCVKRREFTFHTASLELPRSLRFRTVWCNVGMILAVLGCMVMVGLSLFS